MSIVANVVAAMASRANARRSESYGSLSPVNEEDGPNLAPTARSRSQGKQPAVFPDERTPLVTHEEADVHQGLILDDDDSSEYESVMLPDMSYAQVIRSFALVPLACLSLLAGLVFLVTFAWAPTRDQPHSNTPYPYLPHGRAFLVGAAGWVVSYACRTPIYAAATLGGRWASLGSVVVAAVCSVAAQEGLRLGVLVLLGVRLHAWHGHPQWTPYPMPQDEAFRDAWWMALGWSTVEAGLSIFQGYEQLALYKDLFEARDRDEETWRNTTINTLQFDSRTVSRSTSSAMDDDIKRAAILSPSDLASIVDEDLVQSIQLRDREALELVFGVPLPVGTIPCDHCMPTEHIRQNIPVFISCLQRIDAQLLSMGFTLLVSGAYVSEQRTRLFRGTIFGSVLLLHSILTVVWAEALPRIGIHTASYTSLLVAIGTFFAGLALWGALE
ncbi:hypothetical protein FRC10_001264 [Ceratobasidium sp. 414]|nr:hypothetical protein FRC10_001264 [Ceratobasidium sp. 414]